MGDRLAGKVALVTGAASGIGRGCALRLAAEGAAVLVTDVQTDAGAQTVALVQGAGGQAEFMSHDVISEAQWIGVVEYVEKQFGGLNILVNNAGIAIGGLLTEMSLADWQRQQAINLDGVFLGIKHSIPAMCRSGSGSIINISSLAGMKGSVRLAGYCATKGGVRLLSKAMARECAAEGWPIRVNSVHPGIIATPIWDSVSANELQVEGANTLDPADMATTAVPTGIAGQPIDIANGVLFLASDESAYITGTEMVIDAGMNA